MSNKRIFKPRTRTTNVRDAKLIVIATEGQKTETKYFQDLAVYSENSKVRVEILDRITTASSPQDIIKLLDKFYTEFKLDSGDELWLVIDTDRWRHQLVHIARECKQKGYFLAVSNPCFEFWLLLHLVDLKEYKKSTLIELKQNKKAGKHSRSRLDKEIMDILGSYNKSNIDTKAFLPNVHIAIKIAEALDIKPKERYPNELGSHVYRLVKKIISK